MNLLRPPVCSRMLGMESYLRISNINDFLYCPLSLYLHSLYEGFDRKVYHQLPQIAGMFNHERIDQGDYSTAQRYLSGLELYSEKYGIAGKLDVYDQKDKAIIERKTRIKTIHEGYRFQIYAQYLCLTEMGYPVEKLFLHSLQDNKRYQILLPTEADLYTLRQTLDSMREFDITAYKNHSCERCAGSIYGALSW